MPPLVLRSVIRYTAMAISPPSQAIEPYARSWGKNGQSMNITEPITPASRNSTRCAFGASTSRFVCMLTVA
jgi:hypothetical protein